MLKVHIIDYCPHCNGQAYLPIGEGEDYKGRKYPRDAPCPHCSGGCTLGQRVTLTILRDATGQEITL